MDTIQIALVDDHRLFRSGIASLINNSHGDKVLFEAANGEEPIGTFRLNLNRISFYSVYHSNNIFRFRNAEQRCTH